MVYTRFTNYLSYVFPYKKKQVKRPPSLITTNTDDPRDPHDPRDSRDPNNIKRTDSNFDTFVPYEELWKSAIRCKLIHGNYTDIYLSLIHI